ncbi:putative atp binding protein [Zalerion maritima]|uniref:GPN-loop GTPase n=1 Tax=Zalerion maritima TaxID=339359 RepID=A0AAD5RTB8_9PEZI|nr:putative atp binding protein [Zalerion maritima]
MSSSTPPGADDGPPTSAPSIAPSSSDPKQPVAIICLGMAGSGKTTFVQRINAHLHTKKKPPYVINLDPAVLNVPFDSNIDIRDSIKYKEVMSQYNLGPNGAIMTSLNLFATKIDQVVSLCEKRALPSPETGSKGVDHILVDTPGQIEVFLWSASGQIILESLASSFPTVIAYVIDTPRTSSTSTFMSNMLYACSILYKTKLPMILVFNKTDVQSADFAKEWMTDYESFSEALNNDPHNTQFGAQDSGDDGLAGSGYMGSLLNSMSLMLEEFYSHLSVVGVSSMTGQGVDEFFEAVKVKAEEFRRDYAPELERKRKEAGEQKEKRREKEVDKLMKGMNLEKDKNKPGEDDEEGEPGDEIEILSSVDSDEGEGMEDDDDGDEDGLQARYQEQLGKNDTLAEEASFAKYIYSSQR